MHTRRRSVASTVAADLRAANLCGWLFRCTGHRDEVRESPARNPMEQLLLPREPEAVLSAALEPGPEREPRRARRWLPDCSVDVAGPGRLRAPNNPDDRR